MGDMYENLGKKIRWIKFLLSQWLGYEKIYEMKIIEIAFYLREKQWHDAFVSHSLTMSINLYTISENPILKLLWDHESHFPVKNCLNLLKTLY